MSNLGLEICWGLGRLLLNTALFAMGPSLELPSSEFLSPGGAGQSVVQT